MHIEIVRDTYTSISTTGQLFVDGQMECFSLERPEDDPEHPCIPEGNYEVLLVPPGPHLATIFAQYKLFPEVQNVPGRSGIFIHPANWARQLEGCIAPGQPRAENAVYNSKANFERLMTLLKTHTDGIFLTVRKAPSPVAQVQQEPQG